MQAASFVETKPCSPLRQGAPNDGYPHSVRVQLFALLGAAYLTCLLALENTESARF